MSGWKIECVHAFAMSALIWTVWKFHVHHDLNCGCESMRMHTHTVGANALAPRYGNVKKVSRDVQICVLEYCKWRLNSSLRHLISVRVTYKIVANIVARYFLLKSVDHTRPQLSVYIPHLLMHKAWYICHERASNSPRNNKTSNMPYDDCELTQGVTFEELRETEFSQHVDSVKHGWVRLQPYNQVEWINRSFMHSHSQSVRYVYFHFLSDIPQSLSTGSKEDERIRVSR